MRPYSSTFSNTYVVNARHSRSTELLFKLLEAFAMRGFLGVPRWEPTGKSNRLVTLFYH